MQARHARRPHLAVWVARQTSLDQTAPAEGHQCADQRGHGGGSGQAHAPNVAEPDKFTDEQLQQMIHAALKDFYKEFAGEVAFIKYFKGHWAR